MLCFCGDKSVDKKVIKKTKLRLTFKFFCCNMHLIQSRKIAFV